MKYSLILLLALLQLTAVAAEQTLILQISDAESGKPLAARVYLVNESGEHLFVQSSDPDGTAVVYDKQNRLNTNSIERHTTVSPHPCQATVPAGTYTITVERGKSYHSWSRQVEVADADVTVPILLKRLIDPTLRGWYSGDTHIHRTIDELRNIILAEDLNVVFPLTNWVTIAETPPSAGNKNIDTQLPDALIEVDQEHVIWPRNTEYEIFSVNQQRHTLGALFVLGHQGGLPLTVPPWEPIVTATRREDPDVLFDMDKLAWPFAMLLPTIAPDATYEVTNNHLWRTEFAFREWYTPTPPYMQPPFGGTEGGEHDWIDFTLGMYYTLLDCGFRMPPSAGTANGVHPVPAGFGRVYVHLPNGFDYQAWRQGLQQGRSFVTTGPLLFATAASHDPGHVFIRNGNADQQPIPLRLEVVSEQPLSFGELIVNGRPEVLLRVQNQRTETGGYRSVIEHQVTPSRSGWFAVRFWEDRPGGRVRFVHSAPWYVEFDGQPVKPRREEKAYLIRRMKDEIQRSRGVVSAAGLAEYQRALEFYQALSVRDDTDQVARQSRPPAGPEDRRRWLENMIVHHRFTPSEVRLATGMSIEEATAAVAQMTPMNGDDAARTKLKVLPYPGGRHPRRSFLDGAIDPERETKISVFPPWPNGGYAVVDVPEAIFSNLGLTYLAHQHIPTVWTQQGIELPKLEWQSQGGALEFERTLPNGITFGSQVVSEADAVVMQMWLRNETDQPLTGLRSQVCVMLGSLQGFTSQRRRTQVVKGPFVAVKADRSDRWIITAWQPHKRAWTNPPVPCIHSDPIFPDCPPGETVRVQGKLWFYEGEDIDGEIARLESEGTDHVSLNWEELPRLPDPLGVAGPFVGVHNGALIVAGGANFPRPVWENDKQWLDAIYALVPQADDSYRWMNCGKLPRSVAYGAAVSTPEGIVCIGGNDSKSTFSDVFLLAFDSDTAAVTTTNLTSLPEPMAFGTAVLLNQRIYVCGGQTGLTLDTATGDFFSLDLSQRIDQTLRWQRHDPMPCGSRALHIAAAQDNDLGEAMYVIGGRREAGDQIQFLKDVWEFVPATGRWRERQDAPQCMMAGPGIGMGTHRVYVLGGADGSLFHQADQLRDQHPGFPKQAWVYDTIADQWSAAGAIPANHVTTQAVHWGDHVVVASGEVRPRVRSPKVWKVELGSLGE